MKSLTLIGMSGVGKTTVGKLIAMGLHKFVDIDDLIRNQYYPNSLDDLLADFGTEWFLDVESRIIREYSWPSAEHRYFVASPGGSVVYREETMRFLKEVSTIVYLKASFKTIESRLGGSFDGRGIVVPEDASFADVYNERIELYQKWAEHTVNAEDSPLGVAMAVLSKIRAH